MKESQDFPSDEVKEKTWTAKGYPRLAQLMGTFSHTAIVRRFGTLNALNLLSLQAELIYLEQDYQSRVERDNLSDNIDISVLSEDFEALRESDGRQCKLLHTKIRPKLKEYSKDHT